VSEPAAPGLGRRLREWLPEIVFLVVSTAAGLWAGGRWLDPVGDSGSWWSVIYRLANGEILYRDVYLQYGPLSPYLLALGAKVFGVSSTYFLLASWIAAVACGLLLLRVARPLLTTFERIALAGLVLATSLFAPGAGRLVLPYAAAAVHALAFSCGAHLLLESRDRGLKARALGAGALAGLAFCSKQEIGVAILAALAAPLIEYSRAALTWFARCVAGFLAIVVPAAVFVLASAPIESLRANHLWPIEPRPPREWDHLYRIVAGVSSVDWGEQYLESVRGVVYYLALLALLGLLLAREWTARRLLPSALLLIASLATGGRRSFLTDWFHPVALSMVVAFAIAVLAVFRRDLKHRAVLVAIGVFAGLAAARVAFSNNFGGHYSGVGHFATSLTWVLFACVVFPRSFLGDGDAARWTRRAAAVLVFTISWFGVLGSIRSLASPTKASFVTDQGTVWLERKNFHVYAGLRRNVRPGEKVIALPEVNGVDALFRLRNVSPYGSHLPGWLAEDAERQLIASLKRSPPDAVVVFNREVTEFGKGRFWVGLDRRLAAWILEEYQVIESSPGGTIYRRRAPATAPPP
jgi:4-amino-4-deoxy-L-arabinose transferase-like glycosyltransferase